MYVLFCSVFLMGKWSIQIWMEKTVSITVGERKLPSTSVPALQDNILIDLKQYNER